MFVLNENIYLRMIKVIQNKYKMHYNYCEKKKKLLLSINFLLAET